MRKMAVLFVRISTTQYRLWSIYLARQTRSVKILCPSVPTFKNLAYNFQSVENFRIHYFRVKFFFDHGYDVSKTQEEDMLCTRCMELHPECRYSYPNILMLNRRGSLARCQSFFGLFRAHSNKGDVRCGFVSCARAERRGGDARILVQHRLYSSSGVQNRGH